MDAQLLAPKVLNLNNVLVDLVRMLERLIREDIKLFLELEPNLERVEVDLVQLQQVIINLVVNARDAMPRGGQLTLATANIDLDGAMQVYYVKRTAIGSRFFRLPL